MTSYNMSSATKQALNESKDLERIWNRKKFGPVSYRDGELYIPKDSPHRPIYIHREYKPEYLVPYGNYMLNEGKETNYPKTQPTRYVLDQIYKHYTLEVNFETDYWHSKDTIATYILVTLPEDHDFRAYEQPLEILDKLFHHHGYFRSTPDRVYKSSGEEIRVLQYEAYRYETSKRIRLPKQIWYLTTPEYKDSILEKGFIVSCQPKVNWIHYPPRNYFFRKLDVRLFQRYLYQSEKIDNEKFDENDVVMFTVNTDLIPDIMFFNDPSFYEKEAVYTYDDVPASSIVETLDTKL